MNIESLQELRDQLRGALLDLDARCLYASSKWCAELMTDFESDMVNNRGQPAEKPQLMKYPAFTSDLILAKTYFQIKEFLRCAHMLENNNTSQGIFLRCYAKFMAGEREMQQSRIEAKDPLQMAGVKNRYVRQLLQLLGNVYKTNPSRLDGYCLFIFALLHRSAGKFEQARKFLIKSVSLSPFNWSAWLTLAELIPTHAALLEVSDSLPKHWIKEFFTVHIITSWTDSDSINKSHQLLSYLTVKYPECRWLISKTVRHKYINRKFTDAQTLCEDLLKQDPFRLDDMDVYSHILYVKEAKSELSRLAHHSMKIDKYRSETCVIIGNYYSLKGSHQKAITYFNRALKLQPNNLEVLTLMGHEFVEMRNAAAALQAYRRVIDADQKDHKALYGLGQTYEILELPSFAIYYFRKACEIQPYDYRMWNAMGKCYENLDKIDDAIECYKKAEVNDDEQGLSVYNLGRLYDSQDKSQSAVKYYKKFVRLVQMHPSRSLQEKDHYHIALYYLGKFFADNRKYHQAEKYLRPLLDFQGNMKQKAEQLISRMQSERGGQMGQYINSEMMNIAL